MLSVVTAWIMLALTLLRASAIARALVWLLQHGVAYRIGFQCLAQDQGVDQAALECLYDETHANFFPFGLKSYRLRQWGETAGGWVGRLIRLPIQGFRVGWQFFVYVPLCTVYLVVAAHSSRCWDRCTWLSYSPWLLASRLLAARTRLTGGPRAPHRRALSQ